MGCPTELFYPLLCCNLQLGPNECYNNMNMDIICQAETGIHKCFNNLIQIEKIIWKHENITKTMFIVHTILTICMHSMHINVCMYFIHIYLHYTVIYGYRIHAIDVNYLFQMQLICSMIFLWIPIRVAEVHNKCSEIHVFYKPFFIYLKFW